MLRFKVIVWLVAALTVEAKFAKDIVQVTPLPSTSGLYFQYINRMQFVQNIWHFVIEMDHGSVFYRLQSIHQQAQKLQQSFISLRQNQTSAFDDCANVKYLKLEIDHMLSTVIPNLAQQHNLLDQKVPLTPSNATLTKATLSPTKRRSKRGLFNFMGHVDKYLFGIMDSDDAHELHMLANTTNSLNSQVKQLNDELIVLADYVDHEFHASRMRDADKQCRYIIENYNILCKQLDEVATLYNKLDLAVDNAKLNHLNSFVVSPERLLNEMNNVSGHLAGLSWPVPLTEKAMHVLIDNVINVHVFVTAERKLLFIIEVPLVSSEAFDVFHSIPLPYCDKSHKCAIMLPDSKYLGVSVDRRNYVRLDDTTSCRMSDKVMLCFRPQIIYDVNQAKLCDVRIFMKNDKDIDYKRDCDVRVGRFESELFYATSDYNNWLYVLQNDIDLNIQCIPSATITDGFGIAPVVLRAGVGIIHATGNDNCKLTTKKSRLTVHDLYNNLNTVIEIPMGLSYNFTVALQDIDKISVDDMKINNDLEHTNLHELTSRLYDLRRRINNNTVFSGSQVVDDNGDIFAGMSSWFSSIGIDFHYVKIVMIWIVMAMLTLATVKIYRTCCSGACSTLCNNFKICRGSEHTVVRREDRDMYYQTTLPKYKRGKKHVDSIFDMEMEPM
ncbi:ORF8 [Spodoptera exigua multiple nucleopolyhedrovirus]|uniref:F protein n=2 Tax=Spodoptera exigua multiple nucleopolyhedrovirus TaxID=10454 RepID=A0A6N0C1J8_9ABAC|nr:ORF8 [Spodoptera exigua multiple nucleopolyhedrovirus]AAF33539.1 ORF8 [Spodoptera exigua multiple nucleopolyhedrovirus]QKO28888.1 F protein [Spodoptera exigua multiple nucleopolyhedrovirus]UWK31532.1 fusion protein [Spodoptera exigua multiple nucleopolyhedrovirus]